MKLSVVELLNLFLDHDHLYSVFGADEKTNQETVTDLITLKSTNLFNVMIVGTCVHIWKF